jgi:hypothetical protein
LKLQHDPLAAPVDSKTIRQTGLELMEYPLQTSDGKVFQFDQNSERAMETQILFLNANPTAQLPWVLLDNSTVSVDGVALQAYFNELKALQAARMAVIFTEYQAFKVSGATIRDMNNWRAQYEQ